jgi:ABC-type transporter Mla subunit MlaD
MKPKTILYLMAAVCLAAFAIFPTNRLTAQSDLDSPAAAELLQDIQTQQATLADNQKQIDDKLAAVGEAVRQARIYVSRGGK